MSRPMQAAIGAAALVLGCAHAVETHAGVQLEFSRGTERPWRCIDEGLEVAASTVRASYPAYAERLLRVQILVVPASWRGNFTPTSLPTGPRMVVVRQLRDAWGKVLPFGDSSFYHELAEHLVPEQVANDPNTNHDPKWAAITRTLHEAFARAEHASGCEKERP